MGPSGSGKTSLLNFLAGRSVGFKHDLSAGVVSMNGVAASPNRIHSISSFVEQEDTLIGALTVKETLEIAARLSLPRYSYHLTWQVYQTNHAGRFRGKNAREEWKSC